MGWSPKKFHRCLFDTVKLLIDNGADINVRFMGESLLSQAAGQDFDEICGLLLERGAGVNEKKDKEEGGHPLYHAAKCGSVKLVKQFLELGADVNSTANNFYAPLMGAVRNDSSGDTLTPLLEAGADVNIKFECYLGIGSPLIIAWDRRKDACLALANAGITVRYTEFMVPSPSEMTSGEVWQALLTNACLACSSEEVVALFRARHKGALSALENGIVPSDSEAKIGCMLALYYDLCNGRVLADAEMGLVKDELPGYIVDALTYQLAELDKKVAPEVKHILDPSTLIANFGQAIRANAIKRLDLLQQKAQKL